ncbi:putative membrane protein required for spore maturation [Halobacteroides halobius DSM 5150]|uniref:Putative membrane protein required for spore maturation n=1 Tax=Halobacteroides halobius (strain ATCC 35273 / DSM 5150 / MD-1) TaxID=748449 RepID=L0K8S4_HALHC|nr:nucleoside recognition domain-containing protein [Halobacteroides halobius]AGB40940.1 putative membrane protein required for spore maturation [Halobacteroides halobius DSM 5150]
MLNKIWLSMIIIGISVAAIKGQMQAVSTAILQSAEDSIEIIIKLIGPMSLWLGIMKVAEKADLTEALAKLFRPLARVLFPKVPKNHPALGAIMMNLAANLLGLGNSATPLGIKAMNQLQELNFNKKTASDAMCTFLVINTSSVTLIPSTVLALRIGAGSSNPTEIIGTTLFATAASTLAGVLANKVFIKLGA